MLAPALLVLLGVVAYANGLRAPFVFDDLHAIVENPHLRHLWPLAHAASAPAQTALSGRPVVSLSLALNYAIAGLSPFAFHSWNLGVHIASGLLLFAIVRRHIDDRFAFLAAALWLVHPLQTEVVDYTTQRTESMMGLFYLATLYAAIRGWTTAAVLACGAGMATKESMVTAPLMVLAYDATFSSQSIAGALRRRPTLYAGLAASWLVLIALNISGPRSLTAGFSTSVTPIAYAMNQALMIATYLTLSVWPRPLILDYGPVRPVGLAEAWPAMAMVAALVALILLMWRRKPALAFLGTWFFVTLAPSSSIVPIATEVGAERRMYLPLAALAVLFVVGLRAAGTRLRGVTLALGVAAIAVTTVVTVQRNADYLDPVALWRGVVAQRPHGRARHALGFALQRAGRRDESIAQYRLAAPDYPLAHYNLALQLIAAGKPDEAIDELRTRLRAQPGDADARGTLADLLLHQGRWAEASDAYAAYLQQETSNAAAHNNYGLALVRQNRVADAVREFRTALALAPRDAGTSQNLAHALRLLAGSGPT